VQLGTLRELREEIGNDACRFFFLLRSHEQPLDLDLKLARSRTNENPMYYVQYVHARVASVMKEIKARGISFELSAALENLHRLDRPTEQALIGTLLRFPSEVEAAAANCAPHSIVYYLRDVANAFHTYYNAEKWMVEETDLRSARLALVLAAGHVVRNGLELLGVSTPESM
jgi:arginyl-tRNA synthetase